MALHSSSDISEFKRFNFDFLKNSSAKSQIIGEGVQSYIFPFPSQQLQSISHKLRKLSKNYVIKIPKSNNQIAEEHIKNEFEMFRFIQQYPHKNIINIKALEDKYIIMERGGKPSLALQNILEQDKNISAEFKQRIACAFTYQMIEALLYCIRKKIRHNDMHRQNFILGQNGQLKLIDFGLAEKINLHAYSLQNPQIHDHEEKADFKDYHPIDAIIRTLTYHNQHIYPHIVISLRLIGQDETTKYKTIETYEDIILSPSKNTQQKKNAFIKIRKTLREISKILRNISASSREIKKYFSTI